MAAYRRTSAAPRARWMPLRYEGICHVCKGAIPAGDTGFWDPATRAITCTTLQCAAIDGLTTSEWSGSPTSGHWIEVLSPTRVAASTDPAPPAPVRQSGSGRRRYVPTYRCTHEDYPCCGCGEDSRSYCGSD